MRYLDRKIARPPLGLKTHPRKKPLMHSFSVFAFPIFTITVTDLLRVPILNVPCVFCRSYCSVLPRRGNLLVVIIKTLPARLAAASTSPTGLSSMIHFS